MQSCFTTSTVNSTSTSRSFTALSVGACQCSLQAIFEFHTIFTPVRASSGCKPSTAPSLKDTTMWICIITKRRIDTSVLVSGRLYSSIVHVVVTPQLRRTGRQEKGPATELELGTCTLLLSFRHELSVLVKILSPQSPLSTIP